MNEILPKNVIDRAFSEPTTVPPNVHGEWQIAGRVDESRFVRSASDTMRQHPLLDARHGTDGAWHLSGSAPQPFVECMPADDPVATSRIRARLVSAPFDLVSEAPVRSIPVRSARRVLGPDHHVESDRHDSPAVRRVHQERTGDLETNH